MEFKFKQHSSKVTQLANQLEDHIHSGMYKVDEILPSINSLSARYSVSRDTVFKALTILRDRQLIDSTPGKGYYVIGEQKKVFLLLDEYSAFKDILYNSFLKNLPQIYKVDLWYHHYNEDVFNSLVRNAIGNYNYYIIMNIHHNDPSPLFSKIKANKLLLLNFGDFDKGNYSYICQDFNKAFYQALEGLQDKLSHYQKIEFRLPTGSKHPTVSRETARKFCNDHQLEYRLNRKGDFEGVEPGVVYIAAKESDVVELLQEGRKVNLRCGEDYGILAYNDMPSYEVIDQGITAISIDWALMGKQAARFISTANPVHNYLPTEIHLRNSL